MFELGCLVEGIKVKTEFNSSVLKGVKALDKKLLESRKFGAEGELLGYIPESEGKLWGIKHEDGSKAIYAAEEFKYIRKKFELPSNK